MGQNYLRKESIPKFEDGGPAVIADGNILADESVSTEEVIIKEFEDKGESFVNNLEGSFAFVLSDGENLMAARHIGSRHHEYVYDLDEMLKMLLVRSAVANYMLSRMASAKGEETIYCGEGADEVFAGYQYLKDMAPYDVDDELKRLTFSSYKNGFQRVDRMITAFSMQPRLPFADSNVTEYALKLPVKY